MPRRGESPSAWIRCKAETALNPALDQRRGTKSRARGCWCRIVDWRSRHRRRADLSRVCVRFRFRARAVSWSRRTAAVHTILPEAHHTTTTQQPEHHAGQTSPAPKVIKQTKEAHMEFMSILGMFEHLSRKGPQFLSLNCHRATASRRGRRL